MVMSRVISFPLSVAEEGVSDNGLVDSRLGNTMLVLGKVVKVSACYR